MFRLRPRGIDRRIVILAGRDLAVFLQADWQMLGQNLTIFRHHEPAADGIAKFAHITGPRVGLQGLQRPVRKGDISSVSIDEFHQKRSGQVGDILHPLTQWRNRYRQNISR